MIYDVTIFGLHFSINPVAFTIPIGSGWNVYWYGICIAVGFTLALLYAFKFAGRCNIKTDPMLDVILVTTPLAILSARVYYVIFYGEPIHSIKEFFGFDHGGFAGIAIYGGVIGAAVFGAIMCKIKKIKILDMFDLASIGFLIGQGCGRWGNFFNQEAFGGPTGSSWFGMTSQNVAAELGEGVLAHPCFLYESILCFVGVIILHFVLKHRKYSGQVALAYCVWYGAGRAVIEGLRTDSLYIGTFRVSQLLSIVAVIFGAVMLIVANRKYKEKATEGDYVPMFSTPQTEPEVDEVVPAKDQDEPDKIEPDVAVEPAVDEVVPCDTEEGEPSSQLPPASEPEVDEVISEPEESKEAEPEHNVDEVVAEPEEESGDEENPAQTEEATVDEVIESDTDAEPEESANDDTSKEE